MKITTENNVTVRHDEISRLAKQIWEREGRRAGRDLDYWLQAERQLRSGRTQAVNRPENQTASTGAPAHGTGGTIKLPDSVAKLSKLSHTT